MTNSYNPDYTDWAERRAIAATARPGPASKTSGGFSIMGMPVIHPGTITLEESVANIISSIAAEQSAIAHILNAESEKLQAVINHPAVTTNDLLTINRSVKSTVDAVIGLEMALKAKLELFRCAICQID